MNTVLTVACSIFTLTALSIDHYTSIKFPRRRGDKNLDSGKRRTVAVLIVIWIVAAVLSGPELHVRHVSRPPEFVHHKVSVTDVLLANAYDYCNVVGNEMRSQLPL
jgi:hypothetical protein